jgi:hypothetical protein
MQRHVTLVASGLRQWQIYIGALLLLIVLEYAAFTFNSRSTLQPYFNNYKARLSTEFNTGHLLDFVP